MRSYIAAMVLVSSFISAQQPPTPKLAPKPETPRQVLIEVLTAGSRDVFNRHLPEATKAYWSRQKLDAISMLSFGGAMLMGGSSGIVGTDSSLSVNPKLGPNVKTFPTGPILIRDDDPESKQSAEIRVDNEDFSGVEDTLELSMHVMGANGDSVLPLQLPIFRIQMKLEDNVWRFEEIDLTERMPLNDLGFVKQTMQRQEQIAEMAAADALSTVASVEKKYHQTNGKFSCALQELHSSAVTKDGFDDLKGGVDDATRNGFTIHFSNCTATTFWVFATPADAEASALCIDQTSVMRSSPSRSVRDCLSTGEVRADISISR